MPVPVVLEKKPRTRLVAAMRRDQLLEVAAGLLRRGGWAALSMQGLAVAAGVSRQLVYAHFSKLDELSVALLYHLFERIYDATEAVVRSNQPPEVTIAAGYELFLDMPVEERRALRTLATDVDSSRPELARAKKTLRARIGSLWVPYVRAQTGLPEAEARGLAWMLISAAWGLADAVVDGTLDRSRALRLLTTVVEQALRAFPRPRKTSSGGRKTSRKR